MKLDFMIIFRLINKTLNILLFIVSYKILYYNEYII